MLWLNNVFFNSVGVKRLSDRFGHVLVGGLLLDQAKLGAVYDLVIDVVLLDGWQIADVSPLLLLLALELLWLEVLN